MPDSSSTFRRIGRRLAGAALAVAVIALLGFAVTWSERAPIARDLLARELAKRGVAAHFRVATIGVRTQALADIVIGDPAHPDLVARRGEVDVVVGLHGVSVRAIRVEGVRLNARVVGGRLSFGALDRLLPASSQPNAPVSLPDIALTIADGRARLLTPYGPVGLAFDGSGLLSDGFAGRVALAGGRVAGGGCVAEAPRALLHVAVADRAPMLDGPLTAVRLTCGGIVADAPRLALDLRLNEAFDHWKGGGQLGAARVTTPDGAFGGVLLQLGYDGARDLTRGGVDGRIEALTVAGVEARAATLDGRFEVGPGRGALDGRLRVAHLALPRPILAGLRRAAGGGAVYPAAPLVRDAARAAAAAGDDLSLDGDLAVVGGRDELRAGLSRLTAHAASGAVFRSGDATRIGWSSTAGVRATGGLGFGGGGLPAGEVSVRPAPGGGFVGVLRLETLVRGDDRLALDPIRFGRAAGGTVRVATAATVSGALPGGRVDGLTLPLSAVLREGALAVAPGCTPVSWRRLQLASLVLDAGGMRPCANGPALVTANAGGATVGFDAAPVRITGRLGATPLRLFADRLRVDGARRLTLAGVVAVLGPGSDATRAQFASLDATAGTGLAGHFAGGRGSLAGVPFAVDAAAGQWRYADGALTAAASARVSDAATPIRFRPLAARDVRLSLAGGAVRLGTRLAEPRTGSTVATLAVVHRLDTGTGEAAIAVDGLTFGAKLQPDMLSPLTLGIVANVAGQIDGSGRVRWSPAGLSSEGSFTTKGIDLAAAFGQVSGIAGTVRFDDLVNLLTPPHQHATVAAINPGIEVASGAIDYQLLPGRRVGVEEGLWPFAGGTLRLRPTVLDFAETAERRMTLDVSGLDGARFVEMMKFDNIAATGVFDGTLPLVFDKDGGRIAGGSLVARAGGGTLSYVGDVSNAQLGTYGKLAFDALKNLRYKTLRIDLDGALDGEIVSRVGVNGVNQAPVGASVRGVTKQLTGLPFKFNITVKAPFRGLMNSARTFADPGALIGQGGAQPAPPPVQPK